MKNLKAILKKEEGFTLVELMIVVAIIGLLSAVAIPNFKKYQAKAKTSEAKLQLSAAYTAEQSFFTDYGLYANCLEAMGYNPAAESPNRYYTIGFNVAQNFVLGIPAAPTPWDGARAAGINDTTACPMNNGVVPVIATTVSTGNGSVFPAGKTAAGGVVSTAAFLTGGSAAIVATSATTVTNGLGTQLAATQLFRIGAAGIIDAAHTGNCAAAASTAASCFYINQAKTIQSVREGF